MIEKQKNGLLWTYVSYFQKHWQQDYQTESYFVIILWCALGIAINYGINLEDGIIDSYQGKEIRWLWYFLLYAAAYYPTSFFLLRAKKQLHLMKKTNFWLWSGFGLSFLALDRSFYYHSLLVEKIADLQVYYFLVKVTGNLYSIFTVYIPLFICYKLFYRYKKQDGFFGLKKQDVHWKPYWIMLFMMTPLIFVASFETDFSNYYPRYKDYDAHLYWNIPEWCNVILYELAYGWDFVTVELLFRGFFVIALGRILGNSSILPMAVMYCFLHFGKPIGETISSLFGGYILGVLAYYTRNIWGGIFVHLGIAWLMELAAFYQKYR
jgi:hypothetical protein